jgi:hypothetical protein
MFPIPRKHDHELMMYLKEMLESGAFKPVTDRRYPLDQIVEAYRYVETGGEGRQRPDQRPASEHVKHASLVSDEVGATMASLNPDDERWMNPDLYQQV